jgi:hypothetical protein
MEKIRIWDKHPGSATLLTRMPIAPRALGLEFVDVDPDPGESELQYGNRKKRKKIRVFKQKQF